jgi:hypothetical protein
MSRAIGITEFLNKKFVTLPFTGTWLASFGMPELNFKAIIYGNSGHGKTDFAVKFAKQLALLGRKVYYNSFEEGISCTLQEAIRRNDLECVNGKVLFGHKETLDQMITRLKKRNSAQVIIIDSRDYMNLTTEQYKTLQDTFRKKAIILLCWESGGKPKGEYAKSIEFMCDMKIRVWNHKAYPRSRFGGNATFTIWDRQPHNGEQLPMFDQNNTAHVS